MDRRQTDTHTYIYYCFANVSIAGNLKDIANLKILFKLAVSSR